MYIHLEYLAGYVTESEDTYCLHMNKAYGWRDIKITILHASSSCDRVGVHSNW